MSTGSVALDEQTERLGARIRSFRQARGLTLVELARLSDLSHPFLSQLERGHARPSMPSLERIARALGSSQVELMAGSTDQELPSGQPGRASVVLAHEGVQGPFGGGQARILVRGDAPFIPMDFAGQNAEFGEFYTHDEAEFLHVVSGTVVVDLADEGIHTLEPGDSLHYAGGTLHRWRSFDGKAYRMFIVKERRAGA
ncbi:hypothetical protein B5808_11725 [Cnuibacter physcomitrellae]|uniref:HTH cro/C1-type domain-containing protein n=1 Tax=Cnuibacter physcomitrellae TaxID=1619308 RepID=A0A1X9LNG0_9MICO|nr:XRE family transcriptional regulator [Cnuibacter physcomitrellae]ARJ05818.1 hypothetical protein B5808_11725 [Cnuibacter physcomitrellae]